MLFFSTTFSPGAGVEGVKILRFLFPRCYFWCKVPGVRDTLDGCPADTMLVGFTALTGCLPAVCFVIFQLFRVRVGGKRKLASKLRKRGLTMSTTEFEQLQENLYPNQKECQDLYVSSTFAPLDA